MFAVVTRPLWRLRLTRDLPRYLLAAVSLAGLLASARFAIAPPPGGAGRTVGMSAEAPDRAAEGFAVLFARLYLTWDAADPQTAARLLSGFTGGGMEAEAGLVPPSRGSEQVLWAQVIQERSVGAGGHVYTVAAQTDTAGLLYLTVGVERGADRSLALAGYPAFVGPPASSPSAPPAHPREVADQGLVTVLARALRNYLAGNASELAADLTPDAHVALPPNQLGLQSVQRLGWSPDGRSVLARVVAQDARGAQYTLDYELDVARAQGRWEVAAVQMNPLA